METALETTRLGWRSSQEQRDRKALLRRAALAGGAMCLAAGIRAKPAFAHENLFDGYIDVTSDAYGADNSGTNFCDAEIQAAIVTAAGDGSAVYFPPGIYKLNNRLNLRPGSRLIGHPTRSVLRMDRFVNVMLINRNASNLAETMDNIYIDGLSLDGGGKVGAGIIINAAPPDIPLSRHLVIRNVEIYNGRPRYDKFIDIDGDGRYGENERNDIDGDGRFHENEPPGQDLDGDGRFGEQEPVQDLDGDGTFAEFENGSSMAIFISVAHSTVENCEIHDWGRDGIHVLGGSRDVIVRNNLVRDCNDDHIVTNGKGVSVIGNAVFGKRTGWGGSIVVRGGERIEIVGNLIYGSVRGVELASGSEISVSKNTILETGNVDAPFGTAEDPDVCFESCPGWGTSQGSGVNVLAGASVTMRNISITGNVISAPRNHGIQVIRQGTQGPRFKDVLISGNQILLDQTASYLGTNVGSGIAILSPASGTDPGATEGVRIRGNDIRGALGPGIKISGKNQSRIDIQDNRVLDSGRSSSKQPGILVDTVDGVLVANNRAQDTRTTPSQRTQEYGLTLFSPKGDTTIVGNVLTRHSPDGSGNDTVVNLSGSTVSSRLRIRDNVGFNPWAGSVTLGGTLSQGPVQIGQFRYWWKEVQIVFEDPPGNTLAFPTDATTHVYVTTNNAAYTAVAFDVKRTGFKCRVFAAANNADSPAPTQADSVRVYWRAEPVD
jgi:hypothetical protein